MAAAPQRTFSGGPEDWIPVPLDKGLFANLNQDAVVAFQTAMENGFVNELGGNTRFPGLETFADFSATDNGRVYLSDFDGDLIAATSKGNAYRIARNAVVTNVTQVPISGGRRTIMASGTDELYFAAGGPIVRLRNTQTELLSSDAPLSTHVGYIDGYVVATELNSQRFFYSDPGVPDSWPALNVFSADSKPDNINSLLITPFRELMFGSDEAIEQWERLTTGNVPFFRRWAVGDGVKLPYCQVFADNALWTINALTELVRFAGQISNTASNEIGLLLESVDDWSDAWMGGYPDKPLHTIGQKFILLQAPNATNEYGTKGLTIVFDYRAKKFFQIYGWDNANGVPTRWPGWSHWPLWNEVFVGGEGKIYRLTTDTYQNDGILQRWLVRTAHMSQGNMIQIKDLRLQLKRGLGDSNVKPNIRVRCSRDARPFGPWISRDLGFAGDRIQFKNFGHFGTGTTFRFEISSADNCPIDLIKVEVKLDAVGH